MQRGQQGGEEIGAEGGRHAEADQPAEIARTLRGGGHDVVQRQQHAAGGRDHLRAHGGRHDAPRRAVEQGRAELLFEMGDLHGQGGLGDVAAPRRRAEMPGFRERDHIFQLAVRGSKGHAIVLDYRRN